MFEKILSKNAKQPLALLGESGLLDTAYLAGGTALSLQFGHRFSYDFDFFTPQEFDTRIFIHKIRNILPGFQLERTAWGTILGYIGEIRFSLFFYEYPLLFKSRSFLKINIADVKDIASMKISAVADRGTKRDFIDLYFILAVKEIVTIEEVLRLYNKKFKLLKQNKLHILKSLSYFEDAERDEMPRMIESVDWGKVKEYFEGETKRISKKLLET